MEMSTYFIIIKIFLLLVLIKHGIYIFGNLVADLVYSIKGVKTDKKDYELYFYAFITFLNSASGFDRIRVYMENGTTDSAIKMIFTFILVLYFDLFFHIRYNRIHDKTNNKYENDEYQDDLIE